MKKLLCVASLVLLSACSLIPEKLELPENTNAISFADVKNKAEDSVGKMTRWGGIIAKVENQAQKTMIEVVNFELGNSAKPKQKNETTGRFRLYYTGLLDPVIYKEGKSITAIGTIAVSEEGKIGEHEYQFPVLNATSVHLWKNIQRVDVNIMAVPFMYSPFNRGFPINRQIHTRKYNAPRSHENSSSSRSEILPVENKSSTSNKY